MRLNAAEYERLAAQAERAGVGPSTMARSCILGALDDADDKQPSSEAWMASVSERLSILESRLDSAS